MPITAKLTLAQTKALLALADGKGEPPDVSTVPMRNLIRMAYAYESKSRPGRAMITALGLYRARIIRELSRKGVGWGSGGVGSRPQNKKGHMP